MRPRDLHNTSIQSVLANILFKCLFVISIVSQSCTPNASMSGANGRTSTAERADAKEDLKNNATENQDNVVVKIGNNERTATLAISSGQLEGFKITVPPGAVPNDTEFKLSLAKETPTETSFVLSGNGSVSKEITVTVPADVISAVKLALGQQLVVYVTPDSDPKSKTVKATYSTTTNVTQDLNIAMAEWGTISLVKESVTVPTLSFSYSSDVQSFAYNSAVSVSPTALYINDKTDSIKSCAIKTGSTALPSGLSIDSKTCVISGQTTSSVIRQTFTAIATSTNGLSAEASVILTLQYQAPSLSYSGAAGTSGVVGAVMSVSPTTLNDYGASITGCAIKSGTTALPNTLTINTSTCAISGTPTSALASTTYTVVATSSGGNSSDATVTLDVANDSTAPIPGNSGTITTASVGSSSLTLNWTAASDNATAAASITYEVRQSTSNNISSVANAESNGSIAMAYTANTTSTNITGLSPSTTYYFNVIAKDGAGNKALYTTKSQATSADTTAPTPGSSGTITPSSVAATTLTLTWSAATDDVTATASLQYEVRQSSSNNISSVANAESNGSVVMAYTANTLTKNVTSLTASTTYYFNVIVKDAAGNKALYTTASQATTADTTAPTPGNSGTLTTASVAASSLTLNWTAASDDITSSASLQYEVRQSSSNNISSVANAESNGTAIMAYTANTTTKSVTGLSPSTTYYFNVIVKDAAGNQAIYSTTSQATAADTTNPTPGNSGTITTSSVAATLLTLNWTAATDDVTSAASLQYEVRQSSSNNISSVANAESNGSVIMAYTANTITKAVTGLTLSTTYYFNVIVKDAAGNKALYTTKSQATTADTTSPTPGNSGSITTSSLQSVSVTLNWTAATDDVTASSSLTYRVYQDASSASNFSSVSAAELGTTAINAYTANITSYNVTGLTPSSTTYYSVIVKDAAGNKAIYGSVTVTTLAQVGDVSFSVGTGTYNSTQSVTLSTATGGASIYYTIDGSTPTTSSTLYSGAISVSTSKTIKAIAAKAAMGDSNVVSATYTITISVTVDRVYANSNAIDSWLWNYYVDATTTTNDCNSATSTTCIHAGEARKVITSESSCSGLSITDNLGVFDWTCSVVSGNAVFSISGFKSGKGLKDLVNATSWKNNYVTITGGASTYQSSSAAWWTNTVAAAPDSTSAGQSLTGAYTIYTVSSSITSYGFEFGANGVGLVTLGSAVLSGITSGSGVFDASTGKLQSNTNVYAIAGIGSVHFGWTEVTATVSLTGTYYYLRYILISGAHFQRFHQMNLTNGYYAMNVGVASKNITISNSKFDNITQYTINFGAKVSDLVMRDNTFVRCQYEFYGANNTGDRTLLLRNKFVRSRANAVDITGCKNCKLIENSFLNAGTGAAASTIYSGAAKGTIFVKNLVSGSYSTTAIYAGDLAISTFLANTLTNTAKLYLYSPGSGNNIEQLLLMNSATGLEISTSDALNIRDVALIKTTTAISLSSSTNTTFSGSLILGSSTTDCSISGGSGNNLSGSGACSTSGGVTITTSATPNTVFVGLVTSDTANTQNATLVSGSGKIAPGSITDWANFSNSYISWVTNDSGYDGLDTGTVFYMKQWMRGPCDTNANACSPVDWTLKSGDTGAGGSSVALNKVACPSAENYGTHTYYDGSTVKYLRGAIEYSNGNSNGLCESGETCLIAPNLGFYQGHGSVASASGTCSDIGAGGSVQNVTLMKYSSNGY